MPGAEAQEHADEDDDAGRYGRLGCGPVDGIVLSSELKELVPEAEVDAEVAEHAPRHQGRGRKDRLVVGSENCRQEDREQTRDPEHDAVEKLPVAGFELVFQWLPEIDARDAFGGQLRGVGDRLTWLERDAEDVSPVAFHAIRKKSE